MVTIKRLSIKSQEVQKKLKKVYNCYRNDIKYRNGSVLLGVCKGKLSEGIDFLDSDARCVIIVGIPFQDLSDPQMQIKKHRIEQDF